MAGNKNSGRRTLSEEIRRREILRKSWEVVGEFLEDKSIPNKDKVEQAIKLAQKDMPEKLEHSGDLSQTITVIRPKESNGK